LDASAQRSLFGLDLLAGPAALVVGAEDRGLGRLAAERCDLVVSIPMAGRAESLNASVAASLAMFELARLRAG
jgi:23S rRNA (guanosine2251-2'-O)-methyltransferase